MRRTALILLGLALPALAGCVGAPGPTAQRVDPAAGRNVRVPVVLTGTAGTASTLILGVQ